MRALLAVTPSWALPEYFLDKVDAVPQICQSCMPKEIKWGGRPHCAAAAIAESLLWLAENGYPSVQPFQSGDVAVDRIHLVAALGEWMGTTATEGTSPRQALSGLRDFLSKQKVSYRGIKAVGWRSVPEFVSVQEQNTSLSWIKEGTLGNSSVWILVGWYRYSAEKGEYDLLDGHWLNVVGYGKNRAGKLDRDVLVVKDSAERSASQNKYYVRVEELKAGTLVDSSGTFSKYLPRPAAGSLSLSGELIFKAQATHAIVQGAYRLEM